MVYCRIQSESLESDDVSAISLLLCATDEGVDVADRLVSRHRDRVASAQRIGADWRAQEGAAEQNLTDLVSAWHKVVKDKRTVGRRSSRRFAPIEDAIVVYVQVNSLAC